MKTFLTFLSRNKGYTLINVLGLSVSLMFVILIGMYTWQEYGVDRQLDNGDRLETVCTESEGFRSDGVHHAVQRFLQQGFPEIEATCGVSAGRTRFKKGGEYVRGRMLLTDSTFFRLFSYRLLEGDRTTCLQAHDAAVVTRSFARRMFGKAEPVGKTLVWQDSLRLHVTGVVEDLGGTLFNRPDVLVNFAQEKHINEGSTDEGFFSGNINMMDCDIFLLMRRGHTLQGRSRELTDCIHSFWPTFNDKDWPITAFTTPVAGLYLSGIDTGNDITRRGNVAWLHILMLAALVILFFAVTNYINLTVAQVGQRAREMATRRLFGATRRMVFVRLMAESTLLCLLSLLIAVALAVAAAPAFGSYVRQSLDLSLLYRPVAIAVLLLFTVTLGAVSGIVPATILSRVKPIEIVKGTFTRRTKMVLSRVFITVQNVITITMLSCAAIMMSQTWHLVHAPLGFEKDRVLIVDLSSQNDAVAKSHFMDDLRRQPYVSQLSASWGTPLEVGAQGVSVGDKAFVFRCLVADSTFMPLYGIRLNDGKRPQVGHYYLNRQAINEARSMMGIGPQDFTKYVRYYGMEADDTYGGEYKDFRVSNTEIASTAGVIVVRRQIADPQTLSLKITGDMGNAYRGVARLYHANFHETVDSDDAYYADQRMQMFFDIETRASRLVALFAIVAIVISLLGLIAMSTYFIAQRRKEMAIRKVFGSTGRQVEGRLVHSFLSYVVLAFVIAAPLSAYLMGNWMATFSYRLSLWWLWIPAAGIIVLAASYAAVAVQSRQAARENPTKSIQQE